MAKTHADTITCDWKEQYMVRLDLYLNNFPRTLA
jgi:hypothetical protein